MDIYQKRYEEHQNRKRKILQESQSATTLITQQSEQNHLVLNQLLQERRSQRIFTEQNITQQNQDAILRAVLHSPSSCNRQAIYLIQAQDKQYIEQILVGGKNWIHKANIIYLIFASEQAYKSPNEKSFMPYLDAGFVAQSVYLACEALSLGCCFVNPNIRPDNKAAFVEKYGNDYFCGALAIGHYSQKAVAPPLRDIKEVLK